MARYADRGKVVECMNYKCKRLFRIEEKLIYQPSITIQVACPRCHWTQLSIWKATSDDQYIDLEDIHSKYGFIPFYDKDGYPLIADGHGTLIKDIV